MFTNDGTALTDTVMVIRARFLQRKMFLQNDLYHIYYGVALEMDSMLVDNIICLLSPLT